MSELNVKIYTDPPSRKAYQACFFLLATLSWPLRLLGAVGLCMATVSTIRANIHDTKVALLALLECITALALFGIGHWFSLLAKRAK